MKPIGKILFVLGISVIIILRSRLLQLTNFAVPQTITGINLVNQTDDKSEGVRSNLDSVIDGNIDSKFDLKVSQDTPKIIELSCVEYCDVGSVEIIFSRHHPARKLTAEYLKESNKEWSIFSEIDDNDKSEVKISARIKTRKIKIMLIESLETDGIVSLGEIRVSSLRNVSGVAKVFNKLFEVKKQPLSYIYYLILISSFTFLIGFGSSRKIAAEISTLSLSIAVMRGIGIIALLGAIQAFVFPKIPLDAILVLLTLFSVLRIFRTKLSVERSAKYISVLCVIILINTTLFFYFKDQLKVVETNDNAYDFSSSYPTPYGAYQTDFLLPYGVAKIWKYNIPKAGSLAKNIMSDYRLSDRTPLLALYTIPFLNLFGDRLFIFEMISISLAPLFLISTWLLLKEVFGRKIAYLASIFLVFNHWLLFANHFGQVRMLALFFITLFLYFVIRLYKSESNAAMFLASLAAGMAFLAHPFAIIYIFSAAIFQAIWYIKRKRKKLYLSLIRTYGLPLLCFALWVLWARLEPGNSLLISSATSGTWQNTYKTMVSIQAPRFDNVRTLISSKLDNLLGIFLTDPRAGVVRSYGFLRTTFPSAVGLTLIPLVILSTVFQKIIFKKYIYLYSLCVVFFSVFAFLGFYATLGLNWYHLGLIPLFVGIGVSLIDRLSTFYWWFFLSIQVFEYYYISWIFFPEAGANLIEVLPKNFNPTLGVAIISVTAAALLTVLANYSFPRYRSNIQKNLRTLTQT